MLEEADTLDTTAVNTTAINTTESNAVNVTTMTYQSEPKVNYNLDARSV